MDLTALDAAIAGAGRVTIVDGGVSDGRILGGDLILDTVDARSVAAIREALAVAT